MGSGGHVLSMFSPTSAPSVVPVMNTIQSGSSSRADEHWRHFDNSVNAISFGFVATAILISMFLVMAIFERFLRPSGGAGGNRGGGGNGSGGMDLEAQLRFAGGNSKLIGHSSPKMSIYARGVSVLMPGERMPTFIAHPAPTQTPTPCPPERIPWPHHHQNSALTRT